jgi:hypothetical protein
MAMTAWAADLVVLIHFLYILFLILGPLLFFLRWRRVRTVHLVAVGLAVLIQGFAFLCPLTALEVWLRRGRLPTGAESTFILRYIEPLVYPGLSQETITGLTVLLAAATVLLYLWDPRGKGVTEARTGEKAMTPK